MYQAAQWDDRWIKLKWNIKITKEAKKDDEEWELKYKKTKKKKIKTEREEQKKKRSTREPCRVAATRTKEYKRAAKQMLCWRHLLYTIFLFRIYFVYVCPSSTATAAASFVHSFQRFISSVVHFPLRVLLFLFFFPSSFFLSFFFFVPTTPADSLYMRGVNAVFHFWEGKLQWRWPLPLISWQNKSWAKRMFFFCSSEIETKSESEDVENDHRQRNCV